MKSAVTICLVPEARGGPFVFHCDAAAERELAEAFAVAATHGFDGVEIFPEASEAFPTGPLARLLRDHRLAVAAIGTGAGWLKRKLHLCHPDRDTRAHAIEFVGRLVDVAGGFGAPAIIGSMQGRHEGGVAHGRAVDWLAEALAVLGDRAARHGQVILYEPLNRYETNLFNQQAAAAAFLRERGLSHVRLLCDLFHMSIEEADLAEAIRAAGTAVGHVHFADSNRLAMGLGHTDPDPVMASLSEIGYDGWLSAEVFPKPSADEAARRTIESFRRGRRRSTPC